MSPLGTIGRIVVGILLLTGMPFACAGIYEAIGVQQFVNASGQATGVVVDNRYIVATEEGIESGAYYPVVEFTTSSGQSQRFQDGIGSLPPDYEVGARVDVLYDLEEPADARIRSWKRLWFAPALFIVIGLAPVSVFVGWLTLGRVRRQLQSRSG